MYITGNHVTRSKFVQLKSTIFHISENFNILTGHTFTNILLFEFDPDSAWELCKLENHRHKQPMRWQTMADKSEEMHIIQIINHK